MEELINYFKTIEAEFIEETDILQEKEIPQVTQKFYEKIKSTGNTVTMWCKALSAATG